MPHFIFQQADFVRSPISLVVVKNIIKQKIQNCERILTGYIHRTHFSGLSELRNNMFYEKSKLINVISKQQAFLIEARAGKCYWDAVATICHQDTSWTRTHQNPKDQLNLLLNIGYHTLTRECEKALSMAGVYLEVGVLHEANSQKPMLYDFMESFRQPLVDKIILASFSRNRKGVLNERMYKITVAKIFQRLSKKTKYSSRCETFSRVILLEAYQLKKSIEEGVAYIPFKYKWGNSSSCK